MDQGGLTLGVCNHNRVESRLYRALSSGATPGYSDGGAQSHSSA